jgi:hypothetical protein
MLRRTLRRICASAERVFKGGFADVKVFLDNGGNFRLAVTLPASRPGPREPWYFERSGLKFCVAHRVVPKIPIAPLQPNFGINGRSMDIIPRKGIRTRRIISTKDRQRNGDYGSGNRSGI